MRLRYISLLIIFILISMFLPHLIEMSYNTDNPIIIWSYSQADILNYLAAILGIIIALVALFLAIDENRVKLKFDIASTVDDDNDLCFIFKIINSSNVYCKIQQFGFSTMHRPFEIKMFGRTFLFRRLKGQKRKHLVLSPPFELQPNECHDIFIKYKVAKQKIEQIYHANEKIELFVSFVNRKHYCKTANVIRQLIADNYSETEGKSNE